MKITKRDGSLQEFSKDKISLHLLRLSFGLNLKYLTISSIVKDLENGIYDGVHSREIETLASEIAAHMASDHPDYSMLAGRILITNLHKHTRKKFSDVAKFLFNNNIFKYEYYDIVKKNKDYLDSILVHNRDYNFDFFALKTLFKNYLLKKDDIIVERPQHMFLRVAIAIHGEDLESVTETYSLLSEGYFIHGSPTLFSACTIKQQLSSCFLLKIPEDSIDGIYDTLKKCAIIAKTSGGIGLSISNVRAKGTPVNGLFGSSRGIVPMLRVFNNSTKYVDHGGNKRPGSIAIYLEPWHADIFDFLDLRKNVGKEENRARELFYAIWVPDLFMKRVKNDEHWSLMCPYFSPGLPDVWGEKFEKLYESYEKRGLYKKRIQARKLWNAILRAQVETGMPYILYKDSCNFKSNQKNLGTIQNGNLCAEIVQYNDANEIATCNLASISLPKFVGLFSRTFNFDQLKKVVKVVTRNLDKLIDNNNYSLEETKKSNFAHRPIGIGCQGFADALIMLTYVFDSVEARSFNAMVYETLYYGALEASCELAKEKGVYDSYPTSPTKDLILQYDFWGHKPSKLWDWDALKEKISLYGLRNSLLIAQMPTATSAQILGNSESVEPYISNIFTRRVLSGDFQIINKHLVKQLCSMDLWSPYMKNLILKNNGSVQNISEIPIYIREEFKTVWEIPQKAIVKMAIERGPFIDQSQSLNIYMSEPTIEKLSSMHFYGWSGGLKTGMYYLRTRPAVNAIQFTVEGSNKKDRLSNNDNGYDNTTTDSMDDKLENDVEISSSLDGQKDCEEDIDEDIGEKGCFYEYDDNVCLACNN